MNVLIVTRDEIVLRSPEGEICGRRARTPQRSCLADVHCLNPVALVFCGDQTDSLEQAMAVRESGQYQDLPVAILGNEGTDLATASALSSQAGSRPARWLENLLAVPAEQEVPPRRVLIDQRAREVSIMKKAAFCSPQEFRLLLLFLSYPDIVFSREEIVKRVREDENSVDSRIVDVLVRRVRRKIEVAAEKPMHLRTIYGLGYMFQPRNNVFMDVESRQPFGFGRIVCNILFITSLLTCDPAYLNFLAYDVTSGVL